MTHKYKGLTVLKCVMINQLKITQITKIYLPKTKSLGFQWKKASLGVRSPCLHRLERLTVTKATMTLKFLWPNLKLIKNTSILLCSLFIREGVGLKSCYSKWPMIRTFPLCGLNIFTDYFKIKIRKHFTFHKKI